MEGIIINYRRGRKTQTPNQMIVIIPDVSNKEKAKDFIGKTATYTCEGKNKKEIKGTVIAPHGNNGAVKVHFETGMPGQAIGGKISIN